MKVASHKHLNKSSIFVSAPKYYQYYLLAYSVFLIGSMLMALKFSYVRIPFLHFQFPIGGGTWIFPSVFILDDIVTEVYGYAAARRMMWLGIISFALITTMIMLAVRLPSSPIWTHNTPYAEVMNYLPRIILASSTSIFVGSICNDYIMAKIKILWRGRYFPIRSVLSSTFGELALQVVSVIISFAGILHFKQILPNLIFAYLYKLLFDLVGSFISYPLQKITKKAEGIDVYDKGTNFNPFRF